MRAGHLCWHEAASPALTLRELRPLYCPEQPTASSVPHRAVGTLASEGLAHLAGYLCTLREALVDTQDSFLRGLGHEGQTLTLHQAWAAEMAGVGLGPPWLAGGQPGCRFMGACVGDEGQFVLAARAAAFSPWPLSPVLHLHAHCVNLSERRLSSGNPSSRTSCQRGAPEGDRLFFRGCY